MSSSFGGGSGGDINYVIGVDTSQVDQKLPNVSQALKETGASAQQTVQQMGQMPTTLNSIAAESDKAMTSQQKLNQAMKEGKISADQVSLSQKSFGSVMKDSVLGIANAVSGIIGLVSQYTQLQRAQIKLQSAQQSEVSMRTKIELLTRKHADAVAKYGANSQEALDIENKLNQLQAKHATQIEKVSLMQDSLNQRTADFAINILPNVIQTAAGLTDTVLNVKRWMDAKKAVDVVTGATTGLTKAIRVLKIATVVGSILVGLEVASQAIANNWGGLRDRITELYNWLVKLAPAFKPVIDAIWTIGQALTALFTGDIDALTKMFSQSAAAAPAAVGGIDDVGDAIGESGKKASQTQKEIADMWNELSKSPNLTSALNIEIDKDKLTKKFLDYLPDSLTKDIKVFIKGRESVSTIRDSFMETFNIAVNEMGGKDDKWADKFVQQTMKVLKEKFPKSPGSKQMQEELAATISGPDTAAKVKALIEKWKLDPSLTIGLENVEIEMVDTPTNQIGDSVLKALGVPTGGSTGGGGTNPFSKLIDSWKTAFKNFPSTVQKSILDPIVGTFQSLVSTVKAWAGTISTAFSTGWNTLGEVFAPIIDPVVKAWETLAPSAKAWANTIGTAFSTGFSILGEIFAPIVDPVINGFVALGKAAKPWAKTIADAFTLGFDVLGEIFAPIVDPLVNAWVALEKAAPEWAGRIAKAFTDSFSLQGLMEELSSKGLIAGGSLIQGAHGEEVNESVDVDANTIGPDVLRALGVTSAPNTPWNANFWKQSGDNLAKAYITTISGAFNEDPMLGKMPANQRDLMAILGMFGFTGKGSGPQSNIPGQKYQQTPISYRDPLGFMAGGGGSNGILQQQDQNIKGAGLLFTGLIQKAAAASKGIQTEFSSMFTALKGIFTGIGGEWDTLAAFLVKESKAGLAFINKQFNTLQSNLAGTMNTIGDDFDTLAAFLVKESKAAFTAINKQFNKLQSNLAGTMNSMGDDFDTVMAFFVKESKAGFAAVNKQFNRLQSNLAGTMNKIADDWDTTMAFFVKEAKAAASEINSALGNIKDQEVKINIVTTKTTQLKTTRIAKGGTFTSAATGYVTNGPELLIVGDNPGGHETIAAIPHNDPGPTLGLLAKQFGRSGGAGRGNDIVMNAVFQINGNEIINDMKLSKKVKMTVGANRDRLM